MGRMIGPPQIFIRGLGKTFLDLNRREVVALQEFSLTVHSQEFVAILGPSGCGKSTLLNIIAGFEPPTTGEISLDGQPIRGPGADRGVVFQEYGLFPWLTVSGNIGFGLRNRRLPAHRKREIVRSHIRLVGLEGFANTYPRELSGGMKQRVGLARVLALDPKILLMDEPFAALDALTHQQMQRQLLEIWERTQKTVIFVTHSIEEALYLADRVVIMSGRPGRILKIVEVETSRPRDVSSPEFNAHRRLVSDILQVELTRAEG